MYFNGKIYIFGGYDETFQPTNTTRIYDIATNTWTTGAPMPAALGGMAIALWNGIVYVAGGSPDLGASVVNTLYAYNIAANTLEHACAHATGVVGVRVRSHQRQSCTLPPAATVITQLNTLYIYDIASNTWTTGPNVPVAAEAPGSAVLHNQLYVFGGVPAADHDANLQPGEQYLELWAEHERLPVALLRDSSGQSQHRGPWRTGRRWRRARRQPRS